MLIESTAHLPISLAMFQEFLMPRTATNLRESFLRWSHFVAGITWIGLLYFFNLVNVPVQKGTRRRHQEKGQSRSARPCALVFPLGRSGDRVCWSDVLRDVHPEA